MGLFEKIADASAPDDDLDISNRDLPKNMPLPTVVRLRGLLVCVH